MEVSKEKVLETTGQTVEYIKQYSDRQTKILKLEAAERGAKLISSIASSAILLLIFVLMLLSFSITLGFALSSWLGSYTYGFGVVTLIYLVLGVLLFQFRAKLITNPIVEAVIKEMFD